MQIGYYPDPVNKTYTKKTKITKPKVACVMPVYVGSQARTEYRSLNEEELSQELWIEDKLASIRFTIECYKKFKTDVDYELILVDNGTEDKNAIKYYNSTGLEVVRRKNEGFSFGAFKHFWENYPRKFDYYLFHEADYCPCKDNWLEEIIAEFEKEDIGAVGNVLETRGFGDKFPYHIETTTPENGIERFLTGIGTKRNYMCNFDGCYTFTSREVLEKIEMMVNPCTGGKSLEQMTAATLNEVSFQQPILEAGYKIAAFGHPDFTKSDRIYFYGQRCGDLTRKFDKDKLVPIVNGNTRNTCKQMGEYFNNRR